MLVKLKWNSNSKVIKPKSDIRFMLILYSDEKNVSDSAKMYNLQNLFMAQIVIG